MASENLNSPHTQPWASWGVSQQGQDAEGIITGGGVVTDFELSNDPIMAAEQNEQGSIIQQTQYDSHFTATATIQVKHGVVMPNPGATVTIGGKQYYMTSARLTENNTSYAKFAVTLERYALCSQVNALSSIQNPS